MGTCRWVLGFIAVPGPNAVKLLAEWQPSHTGVVATGMCAGVSVSVLIVTPYHAMPALWQLAQPVLIPEWFIAVPAKLV